MGEQARWRRQMYIHFVLGWYRLFFPRSEYDDDTAWEASAHFRHAETMLAVIKEEDALDEQERNQQQEVDDGRAKED